MKLMGPHKYQDYHNEQLKGMLANNNNSSSGAGGFNSTNGNSTAMKNKRSKSNMGIYPIKKP